MNADKRRYAIVLGLMLAPAAAGQTGVIEATVINSVTGAGVSGAEVRVFTGDGAFAVGSTSAAGTFRFENLKPAAYRWNATHPDYLPPDDFLGGRREAVRVDGSELVRVRIALVPPASLRGRVLDRDGNPARGVRVGFGMGQQAVTEADGGYALTGLRAGTYTLLAAPEEQAEIVVVEGQRTVTVPTFYPFVTNPAQAGKIAVAAGADLGGFEIRMQTAPVYRVRGRVLDAEGRPVPRALLLLGETNPYGTLNFNNDAFTLADRTGASVALAGESVVADDDGRFELPAVQRGDWHITAQSAPVYDVARHRDFSLSGVARVLVSGRDAEEVEIRLSPPFDWAGTVSWVDVPPENRHTGGLMLLSAQAASGGPAEIQPDGSLNVANLKPGQYRFLGRWPGSQTYIASILVGSVDVSRQTFELNAATPPFRVVVRNDAGTVRGTVDRGEGATVVLLPRGFEAFDLALYTKAGPGGVFEIRGVRPGDYLAFPLESFEMGTVDLEIFRTLAARATSVRVDAAGTAFLQLRAIVP